jgi:hypothetical protein
VSAHECTIVIPGKPSTDHRARASSRIVGGKVRTMHHRSPEYDAWKAHARTAALAQRPLGWRQDLRYAVEVVGYLAEARCDADNLRGALDALEGVLWRNDRAVRPVVYDYRIDKTRPRVEVHCVAYDPARERAEIEITIGGVG